MPATLRLDLGMVEALLDEQATGRAAYAGGEHLLGASNAHVPLEEATLERSGAVSDPDNGAVTVSYDTPYAVAQHENLTYEHDPGRTAKYLENAMNVEADTVRAIIAGELALP